jgi:hypothetical protein
MGRARGSCCGVGELERSVSWRTRQYFGCEIRYPEGDFCDEPGSRESVEPAKDIGMKISITYCAT